MDDQGFARREHVLCENRLHPMPVKQLKWRMLQKKQKGISTKLLPIERIH